MPRTKGPKMVLVSIHLPQVMLDQIDDMVHKGMFPSRSELIRMAVQSLIHDPYYAEQLDRITIKYSSDGEGDKITPETVRKYREVLRDLGLL